MSVPTTLLHGTAAIEIETEGESGGHCDCCGNESRSVWGWLHQDGSTVASYVVQWTVGTSLADHPANIDMIVGPWGGGPELADDRFVVSMILFEQQDGTPGISVIDAGDRHKDARLARRGLLRSEVVGAPLAKEIFAMTDAILTQDPRLQA